MIDVLILAIALSMDAFAVSIGLGAKFLAANTKNIGESSHHDIKNTTVSLGLMCALYFGVFQGIMPLLGYLGGRGILSWVDAYAPLIAFLLLLAIGAKMIQESITNHGDNDSDNESEKVDIEKDDNEKELANENSKITHKVMLTLAIATSIDAMAAGFSLTLLDVTPFIAAGIIGATTFIFSWIGVVIGNKSGSYLESKAELLGGIILILIGFKMLITML